MATGRRANDITVIIPSIPERSQLLSEAVTSVEAQTIPVAYKVGVDTHHNGPVPTLNSLAQCVETDWVFRLDDDDLLDPDHFEVLSHWLDDDVDIVYTWCRVLGGDELHGEDKFQIAWQAEFGWEYLYEKNWIPSSAAIRKEMWDALDGLQDVELEDWDFWKRALDLGAIFRCVPTVTWSYRLNADWEHRNPLDTGLDGGVPLSRILLAT